MGNKLKTKPGISLVELLIGVTIAGFISAAIYAVYFAHYRILLNQTALINAETQNRLAMTQIANYAKEADGFSSAAQWNGGANQVLVYRLLPLDSNGNPYNAGYFDHLFIERDSGNLVMWGSSDGTSSRIMPDDDNPKIIATGVTAFSITYDDPDYISADSATITLTTRQTTIYGKTFTTTQNQTVYVK